METTTTTHSTTVAVDKGYIRSPLGIVTLLEVVFSLGALICAAIWHSGLGGQWVVFVAVSGFIISLIYYLVHVFGVTARCPTNVPWMLIEFIISVVWTVFFLIAGIVGAAASARLSNYGWRSGFYAYDTVVAATVFCFLCFIVWAIASYFLYREWRSGGGNITMVSRSTTSTTTTTVAS